MPHILFVGIDVSSKNNVVCCLPEGDSPKPLSRFTVSNDEPGVMGLRERILSLMQKHELTPTLFGSVSKQPAATPAIWLVIWRACLTSRRSSTASTSLTLVSLMRSRRPIFLTSQKTTG